MFHEIHFKFMYNILGFARFIYPFGGRAVKCCFTRSRILKLIPHFLGLQGLFPPLEGARGRSFREHSVFPPPNPLQRGRNLGISLNPVQNFNTLKLARIELNRSAIPGRKNPRKISTFCRKKENSKLPVIFKLLILLLSFTSCKDNNHLFIEKNGKSLGLKFENAVHQSDIFNILSFEHLYNGGGVAIADFNNDNQQDVFFTGNIVPNKLFLNEGNLNFKDISETAGIEAKDRWSSGVTTVDINRDGWMDIYVCATLFGQPDRRRNKLYINQGLNEAGIPTFKEEAKKYGIDDSGHSTQAVFFDYDHDDDLDLYVLTDQLEVRSPNKFYFKRVDGSAPNTDRFYKNNGDGTFSNASKEAGITIEGYGLGINVFDVNQDGWLDIYVSNDYLTNDVLYVNNQDGTFSNKISDYIKHQSHSSMGCDVADINNDGLPDILTVEMLPRGMEKMKRMWPQSAFSKTMNNERLGYDFQYMRNMLQVNQGTDAAGNTKFSELSHFSGLGATDWSWAALWNDFDADGDKDLFVANGFPKDITDLDFISYKANSNMALNRKGLLEALPEAKVRNFFFENGGNLTFKNVSQDWGIAEETFSNGAAYGDLDNDGDLDIVVNNINDNATVLVNNAQNINYLNVVLKDDVGGAKTFGATVKLFVGDKIMIQSLMPVRGYISSMQPLLFFGLGVATQIDSIQIIWADGTQQMEGQIAANQKIELIYNGTKRPVAKKSSPIFIDKSDQFDYQHQESRFVDFNFQRLLPRQYSLLGPAIAVGDVDNNGEQDIVLGGSLNRAATILLSQGGEYTAKDLEYLETGFLHEDGGLLLFDADNDGDLDLYATSGGYEEKPNTSAYLDRFYLNDGKGNFKKTFTSVPPFVTSTSCVKGADYDKDGDIDLFVGGRIEPHNYPKRVSSFLLRNDSKGKDEVIFTNVVQEDFSEMLDLGMVTDAVWTDLDQDGWMDLAIVGEWMSPQFYRNNQGKFEKYGQLVDENGSPAIDKVGWWNSMVTGDFDNDGDTDFIAGNLGTNTFFQASDSIPLHVFAKDFNNNGSLEAFFGTSAGYTDGRLYPFHARDELYKQFQFLQKKVIPYEKYAISAVNDLFSSKDLEGSLNYQANYFYSAYIENIGDGNFRMQSLPFEAQIAPIQSMLTLDVNADNFLDVLLVGNDFNAELFAGKQDAFNGLVLYGDGRGNFNPANYTINGFLVDGDAKGIVAFPNKNGRIQLISTQNRNGLRAFEFDLERKTILLKRLDTWAVITFKDGSQRRIELGYGHSSIAQSSRHLILPMNYETVVIFDANGQSKKHLN